MFIVIYKPLHIALGIASAKRGFEVGSIIKAVL